MSQEEWIEAKSVMGKLVTDTNINKIWEIFGHLIWKVHDFVNIRRELVFVHIHSGHRVSLCGDNDLHNCLRSAEEQSVLAVSMVQAPQCQGLLLSFFKVSKAARIYFRHFGGKIYITEKVPILSVQFDSWS